jgi:hypothetical protein
MDDSKTLIGGLLLAMAVIDPVIIVFVVKPRVKNPAMEPMLMGIAVLGSLSLAAVGVAFLTGAIPLGG